jgi:hypothetical protein
MFYSAAGSFQSSKHILSWFLWIICTIFLSNQYHTKMLLFTSVFTCLSMLLAASAVPLTIPLGTTGRSLSISEDGQTISMDGKVINLSQGIKHAGTCKHGGGRQQHGKGGASSNSTSASSTNAKAIYFITNAANNSIVALKVAADGTLSDGSITSTGGAGMSGVDSTGAPAAPDSLFSQGALKVAGNVHLLLQFPTSQLTPPVSGSCKPRLKHALHVQYFSNRRNPAHTPR